MKNKNRIEIFLNFDINLKVFHQQKQMILKKVLKKLQKKVIFNSILKEVKDQEQERKELNLSLRKNLIEKQQEVETLKKERQ